MVRGNQGTRSHSILFATQVAITDTKAGRHFLANFLKHSNPPADGKSAYSKEILMSQGLYENSLADCALCFLVRSESILGFTRSLCWKIGTGGTTRDEIERHEFSWSLPQCGNAPIIKIPGLHPIWLVGGKKQIYRDLLTYSRGSSVKQLGFGHIILLIVFEKIKERLSREIQAPCLLRAIISIHPEVNMIWPTELYFPLF